MTEKEYLRLRRQLEEEYQHKLEALHTVWEMACGSVPPPEPDDTPPKGGGVAFSSEIMAMLGTVGEIFSTKEVEDALKRLRPDVAAKMDRSTVSHTLKRAANGGALEVVETGKGKRPTTYRQTGFQDRCSDLQVAQIRQLSESASMPVTSLKNAYLNTNGVARVRELSRGQANELIDQLKRAQ